MKFAEWKKEFSGKCDKVIECVKDLHAHTESVDENDENFNEDEYLTFITVATTRLQKTLSEL